MKPLSAIVKTVLCIVFGVSSAFSQDLKQAEALYSKGNTFYEENKYQQGIDVLEKSAAAFVTLKNFPGQVKSQNLKAECLANLGQCDKAIEILQHSLATANTNLKPTHPELANTFYYLSRAHGGCSRNWDEAFLWINKSMALKKKLYSDKSLEIAVDYNFLGYIFDNKNQSDSAFYYLKKALAIRQEKLPEDDIEIALTLYNLARVYEDESELTEALDLHLQALKIRSAKFKNDSPTLSNSLTAVGNVYQKFGNYDRALDYHRRALDMRKKTLGESHTNVAASYYNIGNLHNSMFNYHSAIQYYQQGNRILESNLQTNNDILITYFAVTGKMYGQIGEHAKAIEYIKKAEEMAGRTLAKDHPFRGIVYGFAGDYYAGTDDFAAQSAYFRKAVAIFQKAYGDRSVREADVVLKMGDASAKNKRFEEAQALYDRALIIYESKMGKQNPKVASVHLATGEVFRRQSKFRKALNFYRKAFNAISTNLKDSSDVYSNPPADQLENKSMALHIASNKAQALYESAVLEKNEVTKLKQALETYQFAMVLIDHINAEYNNESAKLDLEKESRKTYAMAMQVAHSLFIRTQDNRFLEQAFSIAEKSKSVLLVQNIRDSRAKTRAGVPDSLVTEENDIKIALSYYKNELYQARKANLPVKVQALEKNIFESQQKHDRLKEKLEQKFPAYFHFKYANSSVDLTGLRKLLENENTGVAEYFVDDSTIYIFSITKNSARLERKSRDSAFDSLFRDYEKSLTDADYILNSRILADARYIQSAWLLYDFLLRSAFEGSKDPIQKLIIIPDDFLAQVNFGTLLTEKVSGENPDYKTLHYLTKKCRVSYAYSAAFIKNDPVRLKRSIQGFAGFAPSYSGKQFANMDTALHPMTHLVVRNGDLPLPGAQEEVKNISAFMRGTPWLEEEATETNFKKHAGKYSILHLAMHSLLNSENPEYSELLFNNKKDKLNDGFLKVSEIYNLTLNADLIVLSACSSGYGSIQKGEGPISISRAFSYAGCPAVVMSLWKVPDDVTRQVMTYFYEELLNSKQKDEALQQAQLRFLDETQDPLYHHPYFWAGFVVMGDTEPIAGSPWPPWIFVGVLLITSGIAFGIFKKRVAQSRASSN
jgi:CHAT domain-containing protein